MPENYENDKRYENTKQKIDGLDRNINDLDSKIQDREDFSKYVKDLEYIYNDFRTLDDDIDNIFDVEKKKELKDSLDNLKIIMLDLISDGNIDSLISGETKDKVINDMVGKVDDIFWNEMTNLVNGLELGDGKINEVLSDTGPLTESRLKDIVQFWGVPYGTLSVEGQDYFGFVLPGSGEIYALVNGNLKICEGVLDDISGNSVGNDKKKKGNSGFSVNYSEKPKASKDDIKKSTWTLSQDIFGDKLKASFLVESTGLGLATPIFGLGGKGLKGKIGKIGFNTSINGYGSLGSISGAENGGWKDKPRVKGKITENINIGNLKLGVSETAKYNFKNSKLDWITGLKLNRKANRNLNVYASADIKKGSGLDYIAAGLNLTL